MSVRENAHMVVERRCPAEPPQDAELNRNPLVHSVRDGSGVIGTASSFIRRVMPECGAAFDILTLGGVSVHECARGKGIGSLLVRDVFLRLAEERIPVCLFQNTERLVSFYNRLGAVVERHQFHNSAAPDKALWWDEVVMRYPEKYEWPAGPVDLQGPAF